MRRSNLVVGTALTALALTLACNDGQKGPVTGPVDGPSALLSPLNATDGNPFNQCGNKGPTCTWETGNVNSQKALLHEGDVLPFRITVNAPTPGKVDRLYEIQLVFKSIDGGKNAFDFITRYDASEGAKANLCNPSGNLTATNTANVSNFCNAPLGSFDGASVAEPPLDIPLPFAGGSAGSDDKADEIAASTHSTNRVIQVFGGTATGAGITDPTLTYVNNSVDKNGKVVDQDGIVTFRFRTKATGLGAGNFVVAWGGHISQTSVWTGQGGGAAGISGSPYHMAMSYLKELNDDGSVFKALTTGSRDLQLSANAVVPQPALGITKTPSTQTKSAGETFSWTVTLTNSGTGTATGATISDPLPVIAGVSYTLGAGGDASCVITSGTVNCGPKDLAPSGTLVAVINATTTAGQGCSTTAYTNTATGKATGVSDVTVSATVTLNCASLTLDKKPDTSADAGYNVQPGDSARFTITVNNTGAGSAFNTVLTDTLPAGLTWVESPDLQKCAIGSITVQSVSRQELICTIGTLLAGGSFAVTVAAEVPAGFLVNPPSAAGDPIEIDGNLLDGSGAGEDGKDWETLTGIDCLTSVGCKLDKPTGKNDDSFGQGTKEDTSVPKVVKGSIPNNKSDLLRFYVASERFGSIDYLDLAWERVQAPNGTTNMDFELNQSDQVSSNNNTPVRTEGDILIKYDLAQGGTNPVLGFHKWITTGSSSQCEASNSVPCWGKETPLTVDVAAAINKDGPVDDPIAPDATRTLDALTFGEARIDLQTSGIFDPNMCTNFGSAYLKSRSSDAFTSEIKDFIAPLDISVSNCSPKLINNKAWVVADGITAISNTGQISVTESPTAFLFTAPASERLAQADASGSVTSANVTTTENVTTGVVAVAMDSFDENGRREVRRAGDIGDGAAEQAGRGRLAQSLRATARSDGPAAA